MFASPSLAVSRLEFGCGEDPGPVFLTPSRQEQASVQLTADFQISAVEFTPLFEIATIMLNATSPNVAMLLPGSTPNSNHHGPAFAIESVQLSATNELGLIQVIPARAGRDG